MENISHGFEKLPRTIKPKKENEISKYGISFFGISFLGNRVSKNRKKLIKNKKISFLGNIFWWEPPKKEIFPIKKWWMVSKNPKIPKKILKIIKKFPRSILSSENAKNRNFQAVWMFFLIKKIKNSAINSGKIDKNAQKFW